MKKFLSKLFTKLKLKAMGNFIDKILAPIIQAFKVKSPKIFMVAATVATVLQFGLNAVLQFVIPGIDLPAEFLTLHWIIEQTGIDVSENITQGVMWFLALITGSSSTAWLNDQKRSAKVEKSKAIAAEISASRGK